MKTIIIDTTILVAIIGGIVAVLSASIPYYFTKKNETALNNQKIKLDRYDALLQSFLNWIQTKNENIFIRRGRSIMEQRENATPEEKKAANDFIMAYQRASSYASKEVLEAIRQYFAIWKTPIIYREDEQPEGYHEELKLHNALLRSRVDNIFRAIRKDIQKADSKDQKYYEFISIIYPTELEEAK